MKFGISTFVTDFGIHPADLGRAVEGLGFESLFVAEHSHIPVSRRSKFPYAADITDAYWHCLDPFIALTLVACVTKTLKIGTGICLVIQRDPILVAKEVATLDHVSNGRVIFGVGGGWNMEEMENHGTDPRARWKLLRERVWAMKTIWTEREAAFRGEFVNFAPIWQWPKPVQKPHPPILIAGDGPNTLKRVVEYGDGWLPLATYGTDEITVFQQRVRELNRMAANIGRAPLPVTLGSIPVDRDMLQRYQDTGVERMLFWLPSRSKEETLPLLEKFATITTRFS